MRIIAGKYKGRRLNPPTSLPVRPTTDLARESLFNILNNYVDYDECDVIDLFAGTGAVSIEFLSRGVKHVTAIDINAQCTDYIKSVAKQLDISNIHVVRADVFDLLKRANRKFQIAFADPPYSLADLPTLPDMVFSSGILDDNDGIFILEHPENYSFENHPHFWQHRAYGRVNFTFFAMHLDDEDDED